VGVESDAPIVIEAWGRTDVGMKRRLNFETVLPVQEINEEIRIVRDQVTNLLSGSPAEQTTLSDDALELLVTTFHEIREGKTTDGVKVDKASSVMSTAEAVSVGFNSSLYASYFDKGEVKPEHIVINLAGTVVKENRDDLKILKNYWDVAVKPRAQKEIGLWKAFHRARKHLK